MVFFQFDLHPHPLSSLQYIDTAMQTHKPYFLNPENSQDLSELSITLVTSSGTQNDLVVCLMGFPIFCFYIKEANVAARQKHSVHCVYIPRLKELLYIYIYNTCVCVCPSLACFVPLV